MKKSNRAAAVLVLAAAFGFAAAFLAPAPAEAIPACGWHALYYSDAGFTQLIGERWVTTKRCGCFFDGWGSTSPYSRVVDDPVCSFPV